MKPAVEEVRAALSRLHFRPPAFPVVPNASGRPTTQPLVLRDLLSRHLISPVKWEASMRAMAQMGIECFVEAGPGEVLSRLVRRAIPGCTARSVRSPDDARALAEELGAKAAASGAEEAS
jgi:[acyl-carrier-protein] S-malonyltransferase